VCVCVCVWRRSGSPFVPRVLFGGVIPSTRVMALLVDGLAERSLDELVDGSKRLSVDDAANYAVQLLAHLADLHARGSPLSFPVTVLLLLLLPMHAHLFFHSLSLSLSLVRAQRMV
jgi:hypothetical protein